MSRPVPLSSSPMQLGTFSDSDGAIIAHAGRYARESVLVAFEMIGGVDRLAQWADANPGEFYTKLFPKVITRELEVSTSPGVEDLLRKLDAGIPGAEPHETVDAEFEVE